MGQQPQPPIEDETTELSVVPPLPEGIIPNTGVALAHDDTPVWDIVGNTIKVGNIMLVRLEPEATSQSNFQAIAHAVEKILNEI